MYKGNLFIYLLNSDLQTQELQTDVIIESGLHDNGWLRAAL